MISLVKRRSAELDVAGRRAGIHALMESMAEKFADTSEQEIKECTTHHFCSGVYAREYFLPAGHVVVGRVHKTPCFNIMLKGHMTIAMSDRDPQDMRAPQFFVSGEGEQKALYAHEDTTFITFHATEETDPDKMVEMFTVPTVTAFEKYKRELLTYQENDT